MPGASAPQAVFDGDSLTSGAGSTGGCNYPNLAIQTLDSTWGGYNIGIGGAALAGMIGGAATNVDPKYNASHSKNIVILWGGSNDLANATGTPAQVYANIQTYGAARKAVGWQVVVVSALPRSAGSGTFEADRQTVRAFLLADFTVATSDPNIWKPGAGITYADVFMDIGNDPIIGQAGQNITGPYDTDHIHLLDAGYQLVGIQAVKAINALP